MKEKERGEELKNIKNRIQKKIEKIETEDSSINIGIEDLGSEMVEDAEYRISELRKREERKGEERGKERKGERKHDCLVTSCLVLSFPIIFNSVMICSIRLANILQFLVKF